MSDSQAYEEVTISSDGVAVVKRFEDEEFPVPAIAFDFESDRDEAVSVTMSDTVPDGIEVEDLGFHPEYGSEFWTIDDETITFERELESEESYTTVYGIRATGSDDVRQFLTEPTLESVEPPLPEGESSDAEDILSETDSDVVREAISGEGDIPGLEDETEETEEVATLELNDPNDSTPASNGASGDSVEVDPGDGTRAVAAESGSLTAALATEIREQNVSGEDLKLLRRALEMAEEEDGRNQARIDQLQDDIADLRAYTGALEEFLDEHGTGEQLIEGFEERLESFDDRLESVQSDVESNGSRLESVDEQVGSLDGELEDVSDQVESVEEELDELETVVDDLEESVPEAETFERIEEMEETLEDLESWQEQIKQTFGG